MRLAARIKLLLHGRVPGFAGWFRYYGTRVHFPPGSLQFREALAQGVYEHANLLLVLRLATPGSWVVEAGANIGLLSVPLLASRSDVRLLSLEPSPNAAPHLLRTREGSGFAERWRVVEKAAAAAPGRREFFTAAPAAGAYDGLRDTGRGGARRMVEVEATTIDAEWEALGRPPVSLVRLDVEGAEAEALAGAGALLRAERPWVLLEWNAENLGAHGCPPGRLLEIAAGWGGRVYAVPGMAPIADGLALAHAMAHTESFLLGPPEP